METKYYSKLVGTTFEGRDKVIAKLKGDELLRFRREPENKHDENAVAVDASTEKGWRPIGYIARDKNSDIAEALDMGNVADVRIGEITGGDDKNYGVNIQVSLKKKIKKRKGKLEVDMFGNEIFYDDESHKYFNSLGEVYLSGSKYASKFKSEFPANVIANKLVEKFGLKKDEAHDIKEMWNLKAEASAAWGTAVHAALELFCKYMKLSKSIEKETFLHDNPALRNVVESFYKIYPNTDNVGCELLVVDHALKRAGRIDRLVFDDDGVWVEDYKTNTDVKGSIESYWYQLSFYAAIIIANGGKVKGLRIHSYNGIEWKTYEHDVIDISKVIVSNNKVFTLRPEILTHPNIPPALQEVNPRNIMGKEKWDKTREKVYASTDNHCLACGVHKTEAKDKKWMEAHEFYDIDYEKGLVTIKEIVPLCHYCHQFIHSGRLSMVIGKDMTNEKVVNILEHGFQILNRAGLDSFWFTYDLAKELQADTFDVAPAERVTGSAVKWGDWRLVWKGKKYPPKFKTAEEWRNRWRNA